MKKTVNGSREESVRGDAASEAGSSTDFSSGFADPKTWGLEAQDDSRAGQVPTKGIPDGARVAVIGGGPAGSLFSNFLLSQLELSGRGIELDIYEPRLFTHSGPSGCNHCGGIVSESLVQLLATEGIDLPDSVVQRGIDSYRMHMDIGNVRIETPLQEKRIAAVFRGNGPRHKPPGMDNGLDRHLLELAVERGANWRRQLVDGVERSEEGWLVRTAAGDEAHYDLLCVASGINSALLPIVEQLGTGFRPPPVVTGFIAEFRLGQAAIEATLGTSMHVFLLDLPRLEFAAMIPKGDYVTMCMLGRQVDAELIEAFVNAPEVRACFPEQQVPVNVCHCFPRINLGQAHQPYGDGIVFIGDAAIARLYKDGIGSAYRTAKAAAMSCAFHGIAEADFRRNYAPACRLIRHDNAIGRLVFAVTHLIQKLRFTRRGVLRMVQREQTLAGMEPMMSSVLWDVFTGSAPYRDVLLRTMRPAFIISLLTNLVMANLPWLERRSDNKVTVS